jgi:hypothetical protein
VSDTLGAALWDLEFMFEPAAQLARPVFLGGFFPRVRARGTSLTSTIAHLRPIFAASAPINTTGTLDLASSENR